MQFLTKEKLLSNIGSFDYFLWNLRTLNLLLPLSTKPFISLSHSFCLSLIAGEDIGRSRLLISPA